MNDKIYHLVIKILDSNLGRDTKEDIVRFFLLPRNTPVKPVVELTEENIDLGTISRPTAKDKERQENPEKAAGDDAVAETLKGRVE